MQHPKNDTEFKKILASAKSAVFIKFSAEWCPPCKSIKADIERMARFAGQKVLMIDVDVDACPQTAKDYRISSMPTSLLLVDGEEPVPRVIGAYLNKIQQLVTYGVDPKTIPEKKEGTISMNYFLYNYGRYHNNTVNAIIHVIFIPLI